LLHEVESFVAQRDIATLICGDFNSEPNSAVYQLLSVGQISPNHPDLENIGDNNVLPDIQHITHNLELLSTMYAALGAEPLFTNYTAGFVGTLDYIWCTPSRFRVVAVAMIPDEYDILAHGEGLPSPERPSDHLMICVDVMQLQLPSTSSTGTSNSLFRNNRKLSKQNR
jgi:CCR4-NOT transcription complex subunit 6